MPLSLSLSPFLFLFLFLGFPFALSLLLSLSLTLPVIKTVVVQLCHATPWSESTSTLSPPLSRARNSSESFAIRILSLPLFFFIYEWMLQLGLLLRVIYFVGLISFLFLSLPFASFIPPFSLSSILAPLIRPKHQLNWVGAHFLWPQVWPSFKKITWFKWWSTVCQVSTLVTTGMKSPSTNDKSKCKSHASCFLLPLLLMRFSLSLSLFYSLFQCTNW